MSPKEIPPAGDVSSLSKHAPDPSLVSVSHSDSASYVAGEHSHSVSHVGGDRNLVEVSDVHLNVSQEVIITTEDRVRIHLTNHLRRTEKKSAWVAPLGIFVTAAVTLVTAQFRDWGFPAATWQAIFVIGGLLSVGWFALAVKDVLQAETVDELIEKLKKKSK